MVLGEKRLLQLVILASVESFFPNSVGGYALCKGGLYQHALGTAVTAEKLADFTGRTAGDLAYTGGLLHDIGKVFLDQHLALAFPLFYRRTQIDGHNLIHLEGDMLGTTHPEVGRRLVQHWRLPDNLSDTIAHHHYPEQATADSVLTHLVYLADLLMSRFVVGQELERLNTDILAQRLERVGLRPLQVPVIIDLIPKELFGVASSP